MPVDDPYADDPYLQWARTAVPVQDTTGAPTAPVDAFAPAPPATGPDTYAAWQSGPVTTPTMSGPVTSPEQVPVAGPPSAPAAGPIMTPAAAPAETAAPNAYGGRDVLGGDVNPADRAAAIAKMTPEEQATAVQSMTPDEYVAYKARRQAMMLSKQAELEHQAQLENEQRAREDLAMHQAAAAKAQADTQEVMARANQLANTSINPNRYAQNLGAGGAIAEILNMTLGGAMSRYTGGKNLALDQFQQRLDADVAAQHADMQNRWRGVEAQKGAIAEEYARSGDLYKAQETYRVAAYQSAINGIQSQLQQFDPAGGTAAMIRDQLDGFHAAQAQALNAFGQQQFKNNLDASEQLRKQRETASVIQKNAAETAKLYADASKAKEKDQVFTPPELAAIHPGAPVPPINMNLKDYKTWVETHKAGQEAALSEREYGIGDVRAVRDADGNIIGMKSVPLTNSDGKAFRAPSPKESETLRTQKGGVDTTSQFVDQMIDGIKKYGGASKYFKSPEWQTMMANKEALLFALHSAYGVEGFRPGVLEQMEKALGGQDPTAYAKIQTNAVPGLEAAKKAVVAHFNANLRANGYTGEEYSPESSRNGAELPQLGDRTAAENAPGPLDKMGRVLQEDAKAVADPVAAIKTTPYGDSEYQELRDGAWNSRAESGPRVGSTGLSLEDTKSVQDLIKRYDKGTPATKEKVIAALTAPLGAGRPSLNTGILGMVSENPELYRAVFAALPPDEQEAEKRNQAGIAAAREQLGGR